MSVDEKEATMAYDRRRKHLEVFLKSKQSGQYYRDMAVWADEQGLCTRTAKQYWQRAVWKGIIEINGDKWKWVPNRSPAKTEAQEPLKLESRYNVETMRHELMPEEEDENVAEYLTTKRENKIKEELRRKLKEKLVNPEV